MDDTETLEQPSPLDCVEDFTTDYVVDWESWEYDRLEILYGMLR